MKLFILVACIAASLSFAMMEGDAAVNVTIIAAIGGDPIVTLPIPKGGNMYEVGFLLRTAVINARPDFRYKRLQFPTEQELVAALSPDSGAIEYTLQLLVRQEPEVNLLVRYCSPMTHRRPDGGRRETPGMVQMTAKSGDWSLLARFACPTQMQMWSSGKYAISRILDIVTANLLANDSCVRVSIAGSIEQKDAQLFEVTLRPNHCKAIQDLKLEFCLELADRINLLRQIQEKYCSGRSSFVLPKGLKLDEFLDQMRQLMLEASTEASQA